MEECDGMCKLYIFAAAPIDQSIRRDFGKDHCIEDIEFSNLWKLQRG